MSLASFLAGQIYSRSCLASVLPTLWDLDSIQYFDIPDEFLPVDGILLCICICLLLYYTILANRKPLASFWGRYSHSQWMHRLPLLEGRTVIYGRNANIFSTTYPFSVVFFTSSVTQVPVIILSRSVCLHVWICFSMHVRQRPKSSLLLIFKGRTGINWCFGGRMRHLMRPS